MSAYMPVKNSWTLEMPVTSRGLRRTLGWFAAGAVVLAAVGCLARLNVTAGHGDLPQLPGAASGSLLAQGVTATRDHGYYVVQGEAVNQGGKTLGRTEAVVELFDEAGMLKGIESALVEMPSIAGHEESPFVVHVADPGNVSSFRVRFRPISGTTDR